MPYGYVIWKYNSLHSSKGLWDIKLLNAFNKFHMTYNLRFAIYDTDKWSEITGKFNRGNSHRMYKTFEQLTDSYPRRQGSINIYFNTNSATESVDIGPRSL